MVQRLWPPVDFVTEEKVTIWYTAARAQYQLGFFSGG
jgi:hypothetical protein